jgi:DNA-directed RNA polymerase specialized sigma24 family protein
MMSSFRKNCVATQQVSDYATIEDFRRTFSEGMNELYELSFLVTADRQKAERCFVAGLEESVTSNRVFKEWARSWAKRAIIQNAIRELKPRPSVTSSSSSRALRSAGELPKESRPFKLGWVLTLPDFERFVFVMSVLEHYPDHDCAVLLGCSSRQVGDGRVAAFEQLSDSLQAGSNDQSPVEQFQGTNR